MIVIGLGKAGSNIAKGFSKFPQYETYSIDTVKEADITIKKRKNHEDYDENFPNLKRKLKFSNQEVYVVVAGSGQISGGILRLLQQIQNNKITVVYIQPDLALASEVQQTQEKIVRNVLQEYARSGLVDAIWLVDNTCLERSIGEISIIGYYDTLNQAIVNTSSCSKYYSYAKCFQKYRTRHRKLRRAVTPKPDCHHGDNGSRRRRIRRKVVL